MTVTIKEVDPEKNRISLSMRDREAESAAAAAGDGGSENSDRAPIRRRAPGSEGSSGEGEAGRAVNRGKIAGRGKARQSKEGDQPSHSFKKGQVGNVLGGSCGKGF